MWEMNGGRMCRRSKGELMDIGYWDGLPPTKLQLVEKLDFTTSGLLELFDSIPAAMRSIGVRLEHGCIHYAK
eukprot:scaffold1529_cov243-Chaetoceros_neogracile.AAC.5